MRRLGLWPKLRNSWHQPILFALPLVSAGPVFVHASPSPPNVLYAFTNFAGLPQGAGNVDGAGVAARFNLGDFGTASLQGIYGPVNLALDPFGNIYVPDPANSTLRKVTPAGVVTTVAGDASGLDRYGSYSGTGFTDGQARFARFYNPTGVAIDRAGVLYVADTINNCIRKITPDGFVTTLAGNGAATNDFGLATSGHVDALGTAARFNGPSGIAVDSDGTIYVADTYNHAIRKISANGLVATLAGNGDAGYADGQGPIARFSAPRSIALDQSGMIYVAERGNHTIRKVTPDGLVTTLAGNPSLNSSGDPAGGYVDAIGMAAQFNRPEGVALDAAENVYVADTGNGVLRKISPSGMVTTVVTSFDNSGDQNGAQFARPTSVVVTHSGTVVVADGGNQVLWTVASDGSVSTLAGSLAATPVSVDGSARVARFSSPSALAFGPSGDLYVSDWDKVRTVTQAGLVTTLGIRVPSQASIAVDKSGNLYAGDSHSIQKITPQGQVTTFGAGFGRACCGGYLGLALDPGGNLYVADSRKSLLRRISAFGTVVTVAGNDSITDSYGEVIGALVDGQGSSARFSNPLGMAVDNLTNIYVADNGNRAIRKVSPDGFVTTLAGGLDFKGIKDGQGASASFVSPVAIAADNAGNVYVTDSGTIRRVTPEGTVTTLAGTPGVVGGADGIGSLAQFSEPFAIAVDSAGTLYLADTGNHRINRGVPIMIPQPRFEMLQLTGGSLKMSLTGLTENTRIAVESSNNLRDWAPVRTVTVGENPGSVPISIAPGEAYNFIRATVR